ncbi:hypothetical protein [Glycomyces sp. YM15]|uniref:competence protein CoiA family protein n=1 Tax=Glycomyces sp. YM15 TaxID=2800446 RepID=UPI0019649876|nr:hypothetical protein [Glycomyces sp. YM15]
MASTANHTDLGLLDLTDFELDDVPTWWPQVHRAKPPLTCRTCRAPMTAVQNLNNRWRKRFFKHLAAEQAAPDCWLRKSESEEHFFLKHELARRIREFPEWTADVEHSGKDWRADVLAEGTNGRRIAFEVQLSPASIAEISDRTARYADAGVDVCWVTDNRAATWFGTVPSILIQPGKHFGKTVADGVRELMRAPLRGIAAVDVETIEPRAFTPLPGHSAPLRNQEMPWWTWPHLAALTEVPTMVWPCKPMPFPAAEHERAQIVFGFYGTRSLRSVLKGVLDGDLLPVALGGPFREHTRSEGWNTTPVVWVSRTDIAQARKLLAFAAGWRVLTQSGSACETCGGDDLLLLYGWEEFTAQVCSECDADLYTLVRAVHEQIEYPQITEGDRDAPIRLTVNHALVYKKRTGQHAAAAASG